MTAFKSPPVSESQTSATVLVAQPQPGFGGGGEAMFSLEQWAIIAFTGMAVSLLMIIAGLVVSWSRRRRRARAARN